MTDGASRLLQLCIQYNVAARRAAGPGGAEAAAAAAKKNPKENRRIVNDSELTELELAFAALTNRRTAGMWTSGQVRIAAALLPSR
jgi:hypothetical protein